MSAANALRAALGAGLGLHVDGQDLVLNASAPPPDTVLGLLARHKTDVIAILCAGEEDGSADEWRALYDERAAIAEFDGGLSRNDAETLAHACCVAEWLSRNPVGSSAGECLECGDGERLHEALVPFGTERTGHSWLHHQCWEAWHARRKAKTTTALAAMGIEDRSKET